MNSELLIYLYIYLAVALIITKVPIIGKYFSVANTMIHENAHILFSYLTNGRGVSISLFSDTSGVAKTTYRNRFGRIITSYAGYTGSSFAALALFYCVSQGYLKEILYVFIGLSIYNLLFWVRNLYGIVWLMSFIGITITLVWYQLDTVITHLALFLCCIVLMEQFTSTITILQLSLKNRKNAGDCTSLAEATYISAVFWGVCFAGQSVFVLYYTFRHFILV